jgi:hypothetical protein
MRRCGAGGRGVHRAAARTAVEIGVRDAILARPSMARPLAR